MKHYRYNAAAVVVSGKIFCCGGYDTIECYDPSSDVWAHICYMQQDIYANGVVEMNGHLIVMGGRNVDRKLFDNVWARDTTNRNSEWIEKTSMYRSCSDFGIAKIDGKVFICGGDTYIRQAGYLVQIFDGETWRYGPRLPNLRIAAPAVVIPMEFARYLK